MRSKKNGLAVRVLWWCALAVFVTSAVFLVVYLLQTSSQKQAMQELSAYVKGDMETQQPQQPKETETSTAQIADAPVATRQADAQSTPSPAGTFAAQPTPSPMSEADKALLERFEMLAQQNEDFIGWLSVPGTRIDDPVMYTPNDSQYYLYRDFDGAYAISGLPFLDASCDLEPVAGNKIIYGHNMSDGTRFADLRLYLDKVFFDEQPYLQFDTLYGRGRYQVIAAFTIKVARQLDDPQMMCYRQIDTTDETALAELMLYLNTYAEQRAAGVEPLAGDELLTLSTCGQPGKHERVIVMARRVYE